MEDIWKSSCFPPHADNIGTLKSIVPTFSFIFFSLYWGPVPELTFHWCVNLPLFSQENYRTDAAVFWDIFGFPREKKGRAAMPPPHQGGAPGRGTAPGCCASRSQTITGLLAPTIFGWTFPDIVSCFDNRTALFFFIQSVNLYFHLISQPYPPFQTIVIYLPQIKVRLKELA